MVRYLTAEVFISAVLCSSVGTVVVCRPFEQGENIPWRQYLLSIPAIRNYA